MAEIHALDGKVLQPNEAPEKNAKVGEMLRRYLDDYERGKVAFLGLVLVRPNGASNTDWAWGDDTPDSFPWALAMQGALSALLSDFQAAGRDAVNRTTETGAPDAG